MCPSCSGDGAGLTARILGQDVSGRVTPCLRRSGSGLISAHRVPTRPNLMIPASGEDREMMEAEGTLAAALEAGVIDEPVLVGRERRQLLAVDRSGDVAAAFFFDVGDNGDYVSDGELFRRSEPGRWDSLGSGGVTGDGWTGWWSAPEPDDSNRSVLSILCTSGMDLPDADDRFILTLCHHGFASPGVTAIEVYSPHTPPRRIRPTGEPRAFILITTGLPVRLIPLGEGGTVTGPVWDYTG